MPDVDPTTAFALPQLLAPESSASAPTWPHADLITRRVLTLGFEGGEADTLRGDPATVSLPEGLRVYRVVEGARPAGPVEPSLVVLETIAAGGMGTVVAARQVSLDREIAVKRTRDVEGRQASALLSEARIAGSLQHPNVVPVYDLGLDDASQPILLMKRVEGHTWATVLRQRPEAGTPAWHGWIDTQLRILQQVCNAVHFAHSRGIVHRDLKPANVMVGDFGEVYVVDWGIALRLLDAQGRRIAHFADPARVEGTLACMAPEQAAALPEALSERTDVFQLGALLHAILTGRPPFPQADLRELVQAVCATDLAPLPAEVPPGLGAICLQALARHGADRFASAEALRDAIDTYLQRRPSLDLTRAAEHHLAHLLAGGAAADVQATFGQARFGFQQALASWPGNAEALAGLRATLTRMARLSLAKDDVRQAELLVQDIPDPPADLLADLDAARTAQTERQRLQALELARLAAIAADHDKTQGAQSRSLLFRALGGVFVLTFGVAQAVVEAGWLQAKPSYNLLSGMAAIAVVGGFGWLHRGTVTRTTPNRIAFTVVMAMTVFGQVFRVAAAAMGMELAEIQLLDLAVFAMASVATAAVFDLRLLWMAVTFAVAACLGAAEPRWLLAYTGVAIGVSFWWMDRRIGRVG